ncbi:MAG: manganese efflux pump [Bacteroidales bacterium]|nr:manganese efflux pump [Bacteroidales bacterium]
MSTLEIIIIAVGLAMDSFAVSLVCGIQNCVNWKEILKIAFFFSLFQGAMPFFGWLLGGVFLQSFQSYNNYIAFSIFLLIGIKMIYDSFKDSSKNRIFLIDNLRVIIGLSIATSLDALIVGMSFGFLNINIIKTMLIIFIITFIFSIIGVRIGEKYGHLLLGKKAEFVGGLILIGIGITQLID